MSFSRKHLAQSHFSGLYQAKDSVDKVEQWLSSSFISLTLEELGHSNIEVSSEPDSPANRMEMDNSANSESPVKPEPTRFAETFNLIKDKPYESTKYTPRRYARYARDIHQFPPNGQSSPKFEPLCARKLFP